MLELIGLFLLVGFLWFYVLPILVPIVITVVLMIVGIVFRGLEIIVDAFKGGDKHV